MPKKVIVAQPHGVCGNEHFGVSRSIKVARETAKKYPGKTYFLGDIVHNKHMVFWLENTLGVKTVQRVADIPVGSTVIFRAHGVTPSTYEEARKRKLTIVDATCPIVAQSHREAKRLAGEGKKIVYIASSKDHDEAIGVAGEIPQAITLTTLSEVDNLEIEKPEDAVVMTQTTLSILETKEALERLRSRYPNITIKPGICMATTQRQQALIGLIQKGDIVVIVGSPTSSNSNRLKEVATSTGATAYMVNALDELDPQWFVSDKKVVVSSGASTPEWLLNDVVKRIKSY